MWKVAKLNKTYTKEEYESEYKTLLTKILAFSSLVEVDNMDKMIHSLSNINENTQKKLTGSSQAVQAEVEYDEKWLLENGKVL